MQGLASFLPARQLSAEGLGVHLRVSARGLPLAGRGAVRQRARGVFFAQGTQAALLQTGRNRLQRERRCSALPFCLTAPEHPLASGKSYHISKLPFPVVALNHRVCLLGADTLPQTPHVCFPGFPGFPHLRKPLRAFNSWLQSQTAPSHFTAHFPSQHSSEQSPRHGWWGSLVPLHHLDGKTIPGGSVLPVPVADRLQWGSKRRHPGIQRGSDALFLP